MAVSPVSEAACQGPGWEPYQLHPVALAGCHGGLRGTVHSSGHRNRSKIRFDVSVPDLWWGEVGANGSAGAFALQACLHARCPAFRDLPHDSSVDLPHDSSVRPRSRVHERHDGGTLGTAGDQTTNGLRGRGIWAPAQRISEMNRLGWYISSNPVSVVDADGVTHHNVALYSLVDRPKGMEVQQ